MAPPPAPVVAPPPSEPEPVERPTTIQLRALEQVTGSNAAFVDSVRDVHSILVAQDQQARGDLSGSVHSWFEAMGIGQGPFGKLAFEGWLKAYTDQLGKVSDSAVLARLVMAETQNGKASPYMTSKGFINDEAIKPTLRALVGKWLTTEKPAAPTPLEAPAPPAPGGPPTTDPLLTKTAMRLCHAHGGNDPDWDHWQETLPATMRLYWQALLAQLCGTNTAAAIPLFEAVYPKLAKETATQAMAVEAAGRCAILQRANGQRERAAETYSDLVSLWTKPGITPAAFGLDPVALTLRHIDEILWAARYRSLIGDHENAKIFAQLGLAMAREAAVRRSELKRSQREQLASLIADAYHTLASRVAVEEHHFGTALSLTVLALKTPDLTSEWLDRLEWSAGMYEYLDGNYVGAQHHWQIVQARTVDEAQRVSATFWAARALDRQGRTAEAKTSITAMIGRYPLSYYSTVAATESGLATPQDWQNIFGNLDNLGASLIKPQDYHLQQLRASPVYGLFLRRAEILVKAQLGHLARLAVGELETALNNGLTVGTNAAPFVYLTRLQYRCGAYLSAISMTARLSRSFPDFWHQWPEQILVFFPRPFLDEFNHSSDDTALGRELLLGIARQESGFTPDIRSNANAIGIMQLILPTARKYAETLGMATDHLDDLLRDPANNIRIGSHYLKALSAAYHSFPPAVYGGYNAGEYALDTWLKRRAHSDPLMFVELVPFGETKEYIKSVWRNVLVYKDLGDSGPVGLEPAFDLGFAALPGA